MFFIPHGSSRTKEGNVQQFDSRTYQWKVVPKDPEAFKQFELQEQKLSSEWLDNNCHPEGYFKCPRCYRHHFIPDNFDLLCDGCVNILKEYHAEAYSFEFTELFNSWLANPSADVIKQRMELRNALEVVYKADKLIYNNRQVTIIRDPFKNNGDLEVVYSDDTQDKPKRFIVNVSELSIP